MKRRSILWLGVLACALVSCTSMARKEELEAREARWKVLEVSAPSDRLLWQLILLSIQTQGYPLGAGTDMGSRQVQSGWKTDLQPFRGDGKRWRATVKMSPVEKGKWKLETRVQCEKNDNLVSPLDPQRAQWKAIADDEGAAQVLLQHIRSRLKPELEVKPPPDPHAQPIRS